MMRRVRLKLRFLCMYYIYKYINELGGVGIADNIRSYYRIIVWVRNRKLWWYILFWAVGVILANSYIIYIRIHNMQGTPRKHRWSRHNFRKAIACAWIKPEKYSADEFEFQSEIIDPRRKIKFDLSSSRSVSTTTSSRAWKGWISIRTATTFKEINFDDNNLSPRGKLYLRPENNNWPPSRFSWRVGKVYP